MHSRQVSEKGWNIQQGQKRKTVKPSECKIVKTVGKHRYLMPLDAEMRDKVAKLAKPYPKRMKQAMVESIDTATEHHRSIRSNSLQSSNISP